jgi:hypothetical protein
MSSPGPFRIGLLAFLRFSNIGDADERLILKLDAECCRDAAAAKGGRVRPCGGEKGGGVWGGRGRRGVGRRLEAVVEGRRWCDASARERRRWRRAIGSRVAWCERGV